MGRFVSPDWSAKEEPVPYAKLERSGDMIPVHRSTVDFTLSGSSASGNGFSPASFSLTTSGADMTGGTGSSIYSVGFPTSRMAI